MAEIKDIKSAKGIGTPANKELVYPIYREFGGKQIPRIIHEAHRRVGLQLSSPTLYAWAKEGDWDGRMAREAVHQERVQAAGENTIEQMILCLVEQKEKYEAYFKTVGPKPDHMAVSSYMGLINAIASLKQKTDSFKGTLFLEFMREQINWLSLNDPDALQTLEKNFNDFTAHMKEKYA